MRRASALSLLLLPVAVWGQAPSGDVARQFDRADREAREFIHEVRCRMDLLQLLSEGAFGPRDSVGGALHCTTINGRPAAVALDLAPGSNPIHARRFVAVSFSTKERLTIPFDTTRLYAEAHAEIVGGARGSPPYEQAKIDYTPLTFRFDGDSIEVWIVTQSFIEGRALGGERGYVFSPDGRYLVRSIDAFADARPFVIPDTGVVHIDSKQDDVPTMSEMALANILYDGGRRVSIDMRRTTASLVGRGASAVWIRQPRKP